MSVKIKIGILIMIVINIINLCCVLFIPGDQGIYLSPGAIVIVIVSIVIVTDKVKQ